MFGSLSKAHAATLAVGMLGASEVLAGINAESQEAQRSYETALAELGSSETHPDACSAAIDQCVNEIKENDVIKTCLRKGYVFKSDAHQNVTIEAPNGWTGSSQCQVDPINKAARCVEQIPAETCPRISPSLQAKEEWNVAARP